MAKTKDKSPAYLLLADGTFMEGHTIGKKGTYGGEICFNTGMTGYQEIYTDPSYYGQVIVNSTPHVGNYSTQSNENESSGAKISGLVTNDFTPEGSRLTATDSLQGWLEQHGIVGITDVDTRALVRHIRQAGAMNAIISSELSSKEELQKELEKLPSMDGLELSSQVTTEQAYEVGEVDAAYRVAVLDLGIKKAILDNLVSRGCHCKVFPAKASFEEMQAYRPHAYFISNGPGDPKPMDYAVDTAKQMLESGKPVFGICLGHQILARAIGIETFKMHHGHRGLNHPVKNLDTGLSEMTSQNHGFCVDRETLEKSPVARMTHVHLNDDTAAGMELKDRPVFSVQYHPEASPGPHDSRYLFDKFLDLIKKSTQ